MTECWLGRLNAVTNPHVEKVRPSIIEINLNDFQFLIWNDMRPRRPKHE